MKEGDIAPCGMPPRGWQCSREAGHDGPCAAMPDPEPAPERAPTRDDAAIELECRALALACQAERTFRRADLMLALSVVALVVTIGVLRQARAALDD